MINFYILFFTYITNIIPLLFLNNHSYNCHIYLIKLNNKQLINDDYLFFLFFTFSVN